jgi:hypothetical protein
VEESRLKELLEKCLKETEKKLLRPLPQLTPNEYNERLNKVLEFVKTYAENEKPITIWLGGPGKHNSLLYEKRVKLIKSILEKYHFKVIIPEVVPCPLLEARRERLEVEKEFADIVIIINVGAGTLAEALAFSEIKRAKDRMLLFTPESYREGYAWKELNYRKLNPIPFSLNSFKRCSCKLITEICKRIIELLIFYDFYGKLPLFKRE